MKRFEHTRFYELLEPFLTLVLSRFHFRDVRYILFFTQIVLSGVLYLTVAALQELIVQFIQWINLSPLTGNILSSFAQLGQLLAIFWSLWYMLTIICRMAHIMRFGFQWLTPRSTSCVITAGLTLSIALRESEAVGHVSWFYRLLLLTWAFSCLRPTLFATDSE